MAEFFKHNRLNSEQYPMPDEPTYASGPVPVATGGLPSFADGPGFAPAQPLLPMVDPAAAQAANAELRGLIDLVGSISPGLHQLAEEARQGGRELGYREGLEQAQQQIQQDVIEAATALTDAQRARHLHAQQQAPALADLALKIATRVIGAQLEFDPALVGRIVEHAIQELEPTTRLEVRVNPADVPFVESRRTELERLVTGPGSIDVIPDDSVDHGGCVLVSPVGEVDARISTKLDVLRSAFAAQRRAIDVELGA